MSSVASMDWRGVSLDDGRVLIEASAGTGKTRTIGVLFLRLLLERKLPAESILVITFTDAAANELRERLRARLVDAEHWLAGNWVDIDGDGNSDVHAWLDARFAAPDDRQSALRRVRIARLDFDRAPIGTIHASCLRIQNDFPLASGAAFSAARRLDEQALLGECIDDFWRRRYLVAGSVDADEAQALFGAGPQGLLGDILGLLNHDVCLLPVDDGSEMPRLVAALRSRPGVAALAAVLDDNTLFAPRKTALKMRVAQLLDACKHDEDLAALCSGSTFDCLDAAKMQEHLASEAAIQRHPVLQQLQRLRTLSKSAAALARGRVLHAAYAWCRQEMPRRAAQRQGQTFSMLIESVATRLRGGDGAFADQLHAAFPAILIDEFQDTDDRQFGIFDRICRDARDRERGLLVLIGDPKQAIYGFRGGDVSTYLRVRERVTRRHQLQRNFRSSAALLAACNALYAAAGDAFMDERVQYQPMQASGKADAKPLWRDGRALAEPFALHVLTAQGNKSQRVDEAIADCAARIVELLGDSTLRLGDEQVRATDIAVLLPQNVHVAKMREALLARGVPCDGSGRDSVFEGETARDLQLVLHAALHPQDDRAARGALATVLLGRRLVQVREWEADVEAFEREMERVAGWHDALSQRGAMGLVDALLADRGAELLRLPDGERIVADLRQLGELLAERERGEIGAEGLLAWFAAMREGAAQIEVVAGHEVRSAAARPGVQVMTQHAAKGLEFAIVFLPLAWFHSDRSGQHAPRMLRFHDDSGRACADVGSMHFQHNRERHFREDLQERMRLLYVALTRARHAVHVYCLAHTHDEPAPAWQIVPIEQMLRRAQHSLGAPQGASGLEALARRLGHVRIVGPSADLAARHDEVLASAPRAARTPYPHLRPLLWTHSFSSITRMRMLDAEESAVSDEGAADPMQPIEAARIDPDPHLLQLDAWQGKTFGIAVHALLEHGRVVQPAAALVQRAIAQHGVRARGDDMPGAFVALEAMLARVRESDLGDGLRLSRLGDDDCVAEFGFQLPLLASLARLRECCAAHDCADAWPAALGAGQLRGMLTGFADLVFAHQGRYHVLDYKSNRLGLALADYQHASLQAAMEAHHYPLQALLYTVALHRHLRERLPDYAPQRHLGDSWYVFLRGVGLAPGGGVWRRRWPVGLIQALDAAFAGERLAA